MELTYKSQNSKSWIEDENGREISILEYPQVKLAQLAFPACGIQRK